MARPRADDVRRKVLLQTFAQIAHQGVDGMTMRTVAAATGVSLGTVTYHFANKRQLLLDAITYGYQRPPAGLREGDAAGNLLALLRRYDLRSQNRRTWWRFWLAVMTYAQKDDGISQLLAEQHHSAIGRFRTFLAEGVASGDINEIDVDAAAKWIVAQAHGIAVAQLVDPTSAEPLRLALPTLVDPFLRHVDASASTA